MPNPITQAPWGSNLAKLYDTKGQKIGDPQAELETDRIILTHEMGQMMFSDRLRLAVRQLWSGAIAQSTSFETIVSNLPDSPVRLLGGVMFTLPAVGLVTDFTNVTVCQRESNEPREIPIMQWNGAVAGAAYLPMRFQPSASLALGTYQMMMNAFSVSAQVQNWGSFPNMLVGARNVVGPSASIDDLVMRGTTSAFGGGTREVFAHILIGFPFPFVNGEQGLPVPSW